MTSKWAWWGGPTCRFTPMHGAGMRKGRARCEEENVMRSEVAAVTTEMFGGRDSWVRCVIMEAFLAERLCFSDKWCFSVFFRISSASVFGRGRSPQTASASSRPRAQLPPDRFWRSLQTANHRERILQTAFGAVSRPLLAQPPPDRKRAQPHQTASERSLHRSRAQPPSGRGRSCLQTASDIGWMGAGCARGLEAAPKAVWGC